MSNPAYTATMPVYCAWCKKFLYTVPCLPEQASEVSHGICSECAEKFERTDPNRKGKE